MRLMPMLRRRAWLAAALLLAVAIVVPTFGAVTTATAAAPSLPCDIYAAGGTPCEAANRARVVLYAASHGVPPAA